MDHKNMTRLAQVVEQVEKTNKFKTFDDLCFKVAGSNWAQEEDLDAEAIGAAIIKHNIKTTTLKPGESPPEPPKPPVVPHIPRLPEVPAVKFVPPPPDRKLAVTITPSPPMPVAHAPTDPNDKRRSEGGKGLKHCGGCGMYVGLRTTKCFCGFEFPAPNATPAVAPNTAPAPNTTPASEPEPPRRRGRATGPDGRKIQHTVVMGRACTPDPDYPAMRWPSGREVTDDNLIHWAERFREAYREHFKEPNVWLSNYAIWQYCKHEYHNAPTGQLRPRQDPVLVENADRLLDLLGGNDRALRQE